MVVIEGFFFNQDPKKLPLLAGGRNRGVLITEFKKGTDQVLLFCP